MRHELQQAVPFLPDPSPVCPHVRLEGVIGRGGRFGQALSLARVEGALAKAFGTPRAVAVAISVNSPGGAPVQSRLIHDRIRVLAEEKGLRVFVFCEDVAASGGYMLACAGDEIYADASSLVGSIGVVGAGFGFHEALAKLGVERRVYTAGENKVRLDPFRPEREEDIAFVERIQTGLHKEFIALVQKRRNKKLSRDVDLFQGDVWTGREAKPLGLIDGLGDVRAVIRDRFGPKVKIAAIPVAKPSLQARLFGGGADMILGALERRSLWARFGG